MVLSIKKQNGGKPRLLPGWMGLFWRREIALVAKNWCAAAVLTLESNESVFSVGPVSACAVGYDVAHVVDHGVPIKPLTAVTTSEAVLQFIVFLAANWVYYQKIDLYLWQCNPKGDSISLRVHRAEICLAYITRPPAVFWVWLLWTNAWSFALVRPVSPHSSLVVTTSLPRRVLLEQKSFIHSHIIRVSKKSNGRIESKNIKESLRLKNTAHI